MNHPTETELSEVKALRKQYAEAAAEGLCEASVTPCADLLEAVVQAFAAAEAEEM